MKWKHFSIALLPLLLAAGWWLSGPVRAGSQPFEPVVAEAYAGRFAGPGAALQLKPQAANWTGTLLFKGRNFTIQGENQNGKLAGIYYADGKSWPFTAAADGDSLIFTAGTFTAKLQRQKLPKLEGLFSSKHVILQFANKDSGINGIILFNGKEFQFAATESAGDLAGEFNEGGQSFKFAVVNNPAGLTFQMGKLSEVVIDLRSAAERGEEWAQANLGGCYLRGIGMEKDAAEAVKWYRKAADQGNAVAQSILGVCYENGIGVAKDAAEAVKWHRKAAEQGYAGAQCNLGDCYVNGIGVEKDAVEAVKWYRKAAAQGLAEAQCNLGVCYVKGIGMEKDAVEGVKWCRKAAEQGLARAQYGLGSCYLKGIGIKKDAAEGVKWYRKAAEQGDAHGQIVLAWLLATCEDSSIRNGKEAVEFATKACMATPDFQNLDTLAAAYAEAGDFDQAMATEKRALTAAKSTNTEDLPAARERLALYEAHQPYHKPDKPGKTP